MILVRYDFRCDYCGATTHGEPIGVPTGGVLPLPPTFVVMNNCALCEECAKIAATAMNKALTERVPKGN